MVLTRVDEEDVSAGDPRGASEDRRAQPAPAAADHRTAVLRRIASGLQRRRARRRQSGPRLELGDTSGVRDRRLRVRQRVELRLEQRSRLDAAPHVAGGRVGRDGMTGTTLQGKTALVTGASRGVGKGIARELAGQGARVYITGRTGEDLRHIEPIGTPIQCDHRTDEEVDAAFDRISGESGGLDILVNNVWGGYERMVDNGVFTWSKPFWEQPLWRWDAMFQAGVRAAYRASQL